METEPETGETSPAETNPARQYFSGELTPVPLAFGYRVGLAAVSLAMLALPLVYLSLIAAFTWGTCFYAVHGLDWFFPKSGGERQVFHVLLLLYVAPIAVGGLLVLFLIKPVFARRRGDEVIFALSHLQHPELFRFIGQLCQAVGAPIPSRVDVDLSVNASAGFREGFRSFFGNDIKLAFGLPLAAGMTGREFAAVLAHELGHFTQRTAMRFGFIIEAINRWLARAVFERDAWDVALENAREESSLGMLICAAAQLGIALTRGILWLLMMAGHALSSFLSRQMEFHADACAIGVAGSEGFLAMGRKLLILHACTEQAQFQFEHRLAPKLPDDLSNYIAALAAQCAGQTQGKVLRAAASRKTRWFHSHPSDAERSARAQQANAPGLIQQTWSAKELFGDFAQLSRELTALYYQIMSAGRVQPEQIFRVEAPVETPQDTTADETAIGVYFCGLGGLVAPILIEPSGKVAVGLASGRLAQLKQATELLRKSELARWCEALKQLDTRLLGARQALAAQQAGLEPGEELASWSQTDPADLAAWLDSLEQQQRQLSQELAPFLQAARTRLLAGLGLLRSPGMAAQLAESAQLQDEVHDLMHVFGKLSDAFPATLELRQQTAVLGWLLAHREPSRSELADSVLATTLAAANELLGRIQQALGSAGYPFEHPNGQVSLAEYARTKEYEPDPARMTHKEAESHVRRLLALYYRVLARLTAIAAEVELLLETASDQPLAVPHHP